MGDQPALHDLVTALSAPATMLSARSGQVEAVGGHGLFVADLRALSRAVLTVGGAAPEPLATARLGAGEVEFVAVLRGAADPVGWVRRRRVVRADGVDERITVEAVGDPAVTVELQVAADLAPIAAVKAGRSVTPARWAVDDGRLVASTDGVRVMVDAPGAQVESDASGGRLRWVAAGTPVTVGWSVTVIDARPAVAAPASALPLRVAPGGDRRVAALARTSAADLQALLGRCPGTDDVFATAGSPWYLTLFGRDSIWAARLSGSTDLAGGTLRALAARQAQVLDPATDAEPGKILHELRRPDADRDGATWLPPVYYGTVDATPLWVCLLADTWRHGLPDEQVVALLPAAERALAWLAGHGDGFVAYAGTPGRGLVNQGWKDSGDAVRFADGTIAQGPVALAEVQGYAVEAARSGAELLDAFGRPGAARWRAYADELTGRFRSAFWVGDEVGRYPALALDGAARPVDAPASNMGHLLGTGILDDAESAVVAGRLVHPSLASGFGLRTMANTAGGYSPLSYHCGSVWPHDTAIAIRGLAGAGFLDEARLLAGQLLDAADTFDHRLPELYGGFGADEFGRPVPYPAACCPQAWSAAAGLVVADVLVSQPESVGPGR